MWIRFINEMLLNIKNEIFLISEYHKAISFLDSGYYWVFPRQKCVYYTKAIKCLYNHLWYNHIHSIFNVTCMTKAFCFKHTMYVKHVYWTKEEKFILRRCYLSYKKTIIIIFIIIFSRSKTFFWVVDNNLKTFHNCVLNARGALVQNMSSLSFSQRDD